MVLLALDRLRPRFTAIDPVRFPPGLGGNTIRGALGTILDNEVFAPKAASGPSGLADLPRPFVLRAAGLDGQAYEPGQTFAFDVHLFDAACREEFQGALARLERTAGGRVRLVSVDAERIEIAAAPTHEVRRISVEFVSPTELKTADRVAERPEFSILFARVRDRIATLRNLYGPGPLPIDFRAMGDSAARVALTRCDIRSVERTRRSTRTGQSHSIGGFIGEATYEGDLGEFIPYLRAGEWTGVGRQTTWGKGAYKVRDLTARSPD